MSKKSIYQILKIGGVTLCVYSLWVWQNKKCAQFCFHSDTKYRKLSQSQHVVVLRNLLSLVSPLTHHISNS